MTTDDALTVDEALAGLSRWLVVHSDFEAKEAQMALQVLRRAIAREERVSAHDRSEIDAAWRAMQGVVPAAKTNPRTWEALKANVERAVLESCQHTQHIPSLGGG